MDQYSYEPNSRAEKRAKERARKKRKMIIIISIVFAILIVAAGAFYTMKNFDFSLPKKSVDEAKQEEMIEQPPIEEPVEETPAETITTAGKYPAPTENNNLKSILETAKGEPQKVCALTFDDGPNKSVTPEILQVLEKHDVKATFFAVGENLNQSKDLAKSVHDAGHLLANHTYTQKTDVIYKSWDNFYGEVQQTAELIKEITGEEAYKLVRMPGGSTNAPKFRAKLAENGYYYVDWSVVYDGGWTSDKIMADLKKNTGAKSIVLLMEENKVNAGTLDEAIEYLKSSGYVFKRLDEICYSENTDATA